MYGFQKYLNQVFNDYIQIEPINDAKLIPKTFSNLYDFHLGSIQNHNVIFMSPRDSSASLKTIKKQYEKIKSFVDGQFIPVLVLQGVNAGQRNNLIQSRIPYIIAGNSIYLPFIFLQANEKYSKQPDPKPTKFSASAQLLYLHLFYTEPQYSSASMLASTLELTARTINRAIAELKQSDLLEEAGKSTQRKIQRIDINEYWNRGRELLADPVKQIFTMTGLPDDHFEIMEAGDAALSHYTDLRAGAGQTFAVNMALGDALRKSSLNYDEKYILDDEPIKIQIWRYNPKVVGQNGVVDPISLYASLKNKEDKLPREDIAFEELEEGISNGKFEGYGHIS